MDILRHFKDSLKPLEFRKLLWAFNEVALRTKFLKIRLIEYSGTPGIQFINKEKLFRILLIDTEIGKDPINFLVVYEPKKFLSLQQWIEKFDQRE